MTNINYVYSGSIWRQRKSPDMVTVKHIMLAGCKLILSKLTILIANKIANLGLRPG